MAMSYAEKRDLLKAWAALSLAFTILQQGISINAMFFAVFLISGITVGVGFLLHELAHRYFARKFGIKAVFVSFDNMLILAILMSFFGFIFAAPGAVFMKGHTTVKQRGIIAAAGPATNIILAGIFLWVAMMSRGTILGLIGQYGYFINTLLGVFNLIPFGGFDGTKIWQWNRSLWGSLLAAGILLFMVGGLV